MPGAATVSRVGRVALAVVAVLMIAFLAARALSPGFGADVWFGRTGSWQTVAIVAAVVTVLAVWTFRARNAGRASGVPVAIIGGLGVMSLVLGFSSYWPCYDGQHPKLFTALTFTGALVKGTIVTNRSAIRASLNTCARSRPRSRSTSRDWRRRRPYSSVWPASRSRCSGPRPTGSTSGWPGPSPPWWVSTRKPRR